MAEDSANSSLMTVSIIENLVSEIGDCLKKLNVNTAERYNQMLAMVRAVKSLQIEELYELRKVFEGE